MFPLVRLTLEDPAAALPAPPCACLRPRPEEARDEEESAGGMQRTEVDLALAAFGLMASEAASGRKEADTDSERLRW